MRAAQGNGELSAFYNSAISKQVTESSGAPRGLDQLPPDEVSDHHAEHNRHAGVVEEHLHSEQIDQPTNEQAAQPPGERREDALAAVGFGFIAVLPVVIRSYAQNDGVGERRHRVGGGAEEADEGEDQERPAVGQSHPNKLEGDQTDGVAQEEHLSRRRRVRIHRPSRTGDDFRQVGERAKYPNLVRRVVVF